MPQRIVVVGGGAAGMSAASAARRVDPGAEIVVLEAGGDAAYGLCGLPYFLSAEVERAEDLVSYPAEYFRDKRRLDLRLRATADELDTLRRTVRFLQDGQVGELRYDRLILAAGGAPVAPPVPGIGHERVFTVRTLADVRSLRSLLDAGRVGRALVVGAGYIGLEVAEAFSARGVAVTIAELLPRVMPNLDEPLATLVEAEVRERQVDLRLGAALESIEPTPDGLVATIGGEAVTVDVAVVAVGVKPVSDIALRAGAEAVRGGALLVDDRMRTSLPDVFAAGDCIAPYHRVLRRPAFVPLGPAANKTGRVAGTVAAGGDMAFPGIVGTAVVRVYGLEVARTGLTLAEAQAEGLAATATDTTGKSRAKYFPGSAPIVVRLVHEDGGRLLGAQMVGRDGVAKRIDVLATALYAGLEIEDLAGLDLSYAPPFAPVYEPVLLAAQAALARPAAVAAAAF